MKKEIWIILHSLHNKNQVIVAMEKRTEAMLKGICNAKLFIKDLEREICLTSDLHGNNHPFYCFYLAFAYLKQNEKKSAKVTLANAVQGFRIRGFSWNEAIGEWLFGVIHLENGDNIQAEKACENAIAILIPLLKEYQEESDYKQAHICADHIRNVKKLIAVIKTLPPTEKNSDLENPRINDDKDYLALFSIPIYGTVEAGPNGELHINHFGTFTIVNQINFEKQVYDVHSIHRTAPTDQQITVMNTRIHGWLHVHGLSMNGWDMPFNENDYVLFYMASSASHLDYVIASNHDPSGEMALIVKCFDEKNNRLLSKSKDTSKSYDPIPLDKDHQIVGIVIAIAKPAQ